MDLEHSFTVNAPVDTAWATMMDIEGVAECFPGATVTSVEGDSFEGTCKVKLGPIALVYKGSGSFVERDDAGHRAVIDAKGKDKRGNGTAGATVTMTMEPEGSETRVLVVTDLNVTGKPAQFGRGVMQDVSDKLLGQFVDCLAGKLDTGETPTEEPAATTDSPEVSTDSSGGESTTTPDPVPGPTDTGAAPAAAAMPASTVTASGVPTPEPAGNSTTPRPASGGSGGAGTSTRSSSSGSDDALDLGAAVLPTILRGYAPHVAIGLVAFVIGWAKGRKRRRSKD